MGCVIRTTTSDSGVFSLIDGNMDEREDDPE
jgi:hypothetical protein